jgi:NAD(P)-dependent dehydrogenase (short-subunit alcohol dehydrogenase family)
MREDKMAEERVVVVTGAAGGLGSEIVGQLSARGALVLATDLNEKALHESASKRKSRGEIVAHPANITDCAAVEGVIQAAIDRWGRIDALCNNAGIQGAVKPFLNYEDEELWRVMQANFFSCWLTMKYAIPHMVRGGGGAIVNTGSSLSNRGWKEVPAYVSSKHALLGLTRCAAIEHAPDNIRVNLLCPASMDTPLLAPVATSTGGGDIELGYKRLRELSPNGRIAPPDEVANVAVYLLLDAPRHLSGIIVPVDGAETAG